MLRTYVGYCGGEQEHPTYRSIGDHTEAIAIDYDPTVLSYEDLLSHFWASHHCGNSGPSRQYMKAIFFLDEHQRQLGESTRDQAGQQVGLAPGQVQTAVVPANIFTYAEAYHQKYSLTRHHELRDFLSETYPSEKELADSSVATRLNCWLGDGLERNLEVITQEIAHYGLPEKLRRYVSGLLGLDS